MCFGRFTKYNEQGAAGIEMQRESGSAILLFIGRGNVMSAGDGVPKLRRLARNAERAAEVLRTD
jgi:hypothetical protein